MNLKAETMTVTLSNSTDANRTHTVKAEVSRSLDGQTGISGGQVTTPDGVNIASFNHPMHMPMNINFSSSDIQPQDQMAVFVEIQDFISSARTAIQEISESVQ